MRIVTRPDFDGVVCAVLLHEAENITAPIKWVQPGDMQRKRVSIKKSDIIANLPFHPDCALWFDHHYSNQPRQAFKGAFRIAPSAAGIIFDYYQRKFRRDYTELVENTDKIDAAELTEEEVLNPERDPYILLSMTINGRIAADEPYWNRLVELLRTTAINGVMADPEVKRRSRRVVEDNRKYKRLLQKYIRMEKHVAITDFRSLSPAPDGNRFLVYVLFPEAVVSVRIRRDDRTGENIIINAGHSIFNRNCHVNLGHLLSRFEGGGHAGAASCTFHKSKADDYISRIIAVLVENQPDG